ncbi:helix-turn-helix transcriptional regulator [Novosphingobium album (ex Liu et al. 2023)]|uniref:AlpA family transcriptional regulator n=1 Tax=Novosphingobium album (ex Liu et al. 2023) TaxID=3031130 RepID=A0ABT5WP74_9SPHN|nr:AlpA family transcriptional regulator [Novosphingobium album (ex Liu et al. 2023)]MDE8651828.1 AlpA family transcriptional regulator [Novosphingobium album (ex Liu et al. 2023)]
MAEAHLSGSDRFMRRKEVERETGLSRPTIYRQMAAGNFPRPRRIGVQAVAWVASEIEEWKRQRPLVAPDD